MQGEEGGGMVSGERQETREAWSSTSALMAAASAFWCRARKGASRGEGERVRERGKLGRPLWRVQRRSREVGTCDSGA